MPPEEKPKDKKSGFGIDDSDLFRQIFSDVCTHCVHMDHLSPVSGKKIPICKAFPKGIPDEIWQGKNDHTKPHPGDNGIQFKVDPESYKAKKK